MEVNAVIMESVLQHHLGAPIATVLLHKKEGGKDLNVVFWFVLIIVLVRIDYLFGV